MNNTDISPKTWQLDKVHSDARYIMEERKM